MKYVLIDLSFIVYRSAFMQDEFGDLEASIMYNTLNQIRRVCSHPRVDSNRVLVFIDSKTSLRTKIYPDYKAHRKSRKDDDCRFRVASKFTRELFTELSAIGFPTYTQEGLESDDLMAIAAQDITENGESAVIITSDADLMQCVNDHIHWFDPQREKYVTSKSFKNEKGIGCEQFGMVKALGGCKSDNVCGVRSVGEKTAIKYLNGELPETDKKFLAIKEEEENGELDRWMELTILPHPETEHIELKECNFNVDFVAGLYTKYGIGHCFGKKMWERFFNGESIRGSLTGKKGRWNRRLNRT